MTDFSVPLPPYSSLKRSTKPIRAHKKAQKRVGKLGIVRLAGKALEQLRFDCYVLACGLCNECRVATSDGFPDWHDRKYHMAHIGNKRMHGDVLSNVRVLCGACHRAEHGNPLPK